MIDRLWNRNVILHYLYITWEPAKMSMYYHGSGPYSKYLQDRSIAWDISNTVRTTGKDVSLSISDQTKEIIANNQILQDRFGSQFNALTNQLSMGMDGVRDVLEAVGNNIEQAVSNLHSLLDERSAQLLFKLDTIMMIQQGIHNAILIPEFKKEQKYLIERGYDFLLDGRTEMALDNLLKAEQSESDFSHYQVLEVIGTIYLRHAALFDARKAKDYFLRAAFFAKPERKNPLKAAEYYMHASWAAYLLNEIDDAISNAWESLFFNSHLSKSVFLLAKYYAVRGDENGVLKQLEEAIGMDRNYCILADNDGDFAPYKQQIHTLLESSGNRQETWRFP